MITKEMTDEMVDILDEGNDVLLRKKVVEGRKILSIMAIRPVKIYEDGQKLRPAHAYKRPDKRRI